MNILELAHKRPAIGQWVAAWRDDHAWRWSAAAHYAFLRDQANELLHASVIAIDIRNHLALEAHAKFQHYSAAIIEASRTFRWHYDYDVTENGNLFATIDGSGYLKAVDSLDLLGCVDDHHGGEAEFSITKRVDFQPVLIGFLHELTVERPSGAPWRLVLRRRGPAPKRWADHPIPT